MSHLTPTQDADLDVRMQQRQVRRDLQRTHDRVVLRVEVPFVMNRYMARAAPHLDARTAQIGVARGNELRQQLERFGSGAKHRAYQVMPRLWIGHDLANE